jgi:hypothetical protein
MMTFSALTLILSGQVFGQEVGNKDKVDQTDSLKNNYGEWSRFSLGFGGFFAGYNSGITLGADGTGLGLIVDIEDALGITSSTWAFRSHADYRFGKRQRNQLVINYFGINRNATKVLEQELELGDTVYAIGTEIKSRYNFSIIRIKYNYAFLQDERVSMGASFGFFIMPLSFRVDAPDFDAQATDFVAPLPMLGLRTSIKLTPKFRLTQTSELLYIAVAGLEGSLLDLSLSLDYSLTRNLDFGLAVNSNRIAVRMVEDAPVFDFFGDIRMSYTGLMLYARYNFY